MSMSIAQAALPGQLEPSSGKAKPIRTSARVACSECRKIKLRCESDDGTQKCRRCTASGLVCERPESKRGKWVRNASVQPRGIQGNTVASGSMPSSATHHLFDQGGDGTDRSGSPDDNDSSTLDFFVPPDSVAPSSLAPLQGLAATALSTTTNVTTAPARSTWTRRAEPNLVSEAEEVEDFNGRLHFKITHQVPPLGILAEASMRLSKSKSGLTGDDTGTAGTANAGYKLLGMANRSYFGQSLQKHLRPRNIGRVIPSVVSKGVITVAKSQELFNRFFTYCQPLVGLLDDRVTTPSVCAGKSSFLFTTICAIAARYEFPRDLHDRLLSEARQEGMKAIFDNKSLCTVQGFLLLAWWNEPTASYEDDNTYLYAGIAFRLAMEIGLHHTNHISFPADFDSHIRRQYELELLDRERTYRLCYAHDRMIMLQTGKPDTVLESSTVRSVAGNWDSPLATLHDIRVSAATELMQIVTRLFYTIYSSVESLSGINASVDFQRIVVRENHMRIDAWYLRWKGRLAKRPPSQTLQIFEGLMNLDQEVVKLIIDFVCLSRLLETGKENFESIGFAVGCYHSAITVLTLVRDKFASLPILRYAPDYLLINIVYCATILFKLWRSSVSHVCDSDSDLELVHQVIIAMENSAQDETHGPMLYAVFLRRQLTDYRTRDKPAVVPAQPDLQPFPSDFLGTLAAQSLFTDFDPNILGLLNNNQEVVQLASGTDVDPFHTEGLFSTDWLDDILGNQSTMQQPFYQAPEQDLWELFGNSDVFSQVQNNA